LGVSPKIHGRVACATRESVSDLTVQYFAVNLAERFSARLNGFAASMKSNRMLVTNLFGLIMTLETKQLLCRFDEPGAFEFPARFDYDDLERRATLVHEDIRSAGIQAGFEGAIHNQDASFSIAIPLHSFERVNAIAILQPTVRFSNFGNLATMTWIDQIPETARAEIRASLGKHGFNYVRADELDCDYDGIMADNKDTFRTWWNRYFDWL